MKNKILLLFIMILTLAGVTSCVVNDEQNKVNPKVEKIDEVIDVFVKDYASNYLKFENETYTIDFQVLTGLYLLEQSGYDVKVSDYISKESIKNYVDTLDYQTANQIFITSVIDKIYGLTTTKAKEALSSLETVDQWSLTYAYSALKHYGVNEALKEEIASKLTVIRPEDYRDADYAGIALCVLSDEQVDKAPLYDLISSSLTKDGISSWGTANACSTSYSIIGLIASGVDIEKEYVDEEYETLVDNLFKFVENGKFKWELAGVIDESFATPQGFLALCTYRAYLEKLEVVEIF